MGKQDKLYDALYRRLYSQFGLYSCELWLFYYLLINNEEMTQKDLCDQLTFPKQTVNSAVSNLVKKGCLTLKESPDNRKNKILNLTKKGKGSSNPVCRKTS